MSEMILKADAGNWATIQNPQFTGITFQIRQIEDMEIGDLRIRDLVFKAIEHPIADPGLPSRSRNIKIRVYPGQDKTEYFALELQDEPLPEQIQDALHEAETDLKLTVGNDHEEHQILYTRGDSWDCRSTIAEPQGRRHTRAVAIHNYSRSTENGTEFLSVEQSGDKIQVWWGFPVQPSDISVF